jgi:hypothetical protein
MDLFRQYWTKGSPVKREPQRVRNIHGLSVDLENVTPVLSESEEDTDEDLHQELGEPAENTLQVARPSLTKLMLASGDSRPTEYPIKAIIEDLGEEIKGLKDEFKSQSPRSSTSDSFDPLMRKRRKFDKFVYDEDHEHELCPQCRGSLDSDEEDIERWSKLKKHRLHRCLWKLKYNRIVSSFYLDTLREREERWSWMIILISTLTSGFTVANNVEDEPFENYSIGINIILTTSSMTTSLIAAWIKKQRFVERINEVDKYLIDINKLCEELEIQFTLFEGDRLSYSEFKKKYIPEITKFVSTNPMIPPDEWKLCVREITLKYPELVDPDNSESNKLWPWFGDLVKYTDDKGITHNIRKPTTFMKYMKRTSKDRILSSCCRTHKECDNVYK